MESSPSLGLNRRARDDLEPAVSVCIGPPFKGTSLVHDVLYAMKCVRPMIGGNTDQALNSENVITKFVEKISCPPIKHDQVNWPHQPAGHADLFAIVKMFCVGVLA